VNEEVEDAPPKFYFGGAFIFIRHQPMDGRTNAKLRNFLMLYTLSSHKPAAMW
jgi:hypothetical protein